MNSEIYEMLSPACETRNLDIQEVVDAIRRLSVATKIDEANLAIAVQCEMYNEFNMSNVIDMTRTSG